jgi:hypothetical protein
VGKPVAISIAFGGGGIKIHKTPKRMVKSAQKLRAIAQGLYRYFFKERIVFSILFLHYAPTLRIDKRIKTI